MSMQNLNRNGFTIIELVLVIVVLSIIAAVAMPRMFNFKRDAKIATLNGLYGTLKSSISIAHGACLVDSSCNPNLAFQTFEIDGRSIEMVYGYPASTASGIASLIDVNNFSIEYINSPPLHFAIFHFGPPLVNCGVAYSQSNINSLNSDKVILVIDDC